MSSLRKRTLLIALLALGLWLLFFDSHSVLRRVQWHHEHHTLLEENARLEAEIATLEAQMEALDSDLVIERIAREQYGMRRPGETVYRVVEP
ncbi:MAG: septum formation initiator family protein [Bacteroidetes bacterium]|nr:hypothetical protein AWN76_004265 [Rhodothermaceae bacterium RA]RMH52207.1 MAG: septum formation initiator family protein [Bacteroidota bacterium]